VENEGLRGTLRNLLYGSVLFWPSWELSVWRCQCLPPRRPKM